MLSGCWLLVSLSLLLLRMCYTVDRICAELVRGPWDSEDLGSSPSSSLAVNVGKFSLFSYLSFLIQNMNYDNEDGLLRQL